MSSSTLLRVNIFKSRSMLRLLLYTSVILMSILGFSLATANVGPSIVKIYASRSQPDYYNPWNMESSRPSSGSGCIIDGNRILTNAHVVSDQTFLQVRLQGQPRKYTARVHAVSHEADLALLVPDDPSLFNNVEPLAFGELPEVQQDVVVYGFPLGGDTLSMTKGVVSRIEHQTYVHSSMALLAVQLDAAVNPGNSGGPVMTGDHLVGVVMQIMRNTDNISYMVPVPVIEHFLTDMADDRYDGFPELGISGQSMENTGLKSMYGLEQDQGGVLVTHVIPGTPAAEKLRPEDVILSIDGHDIADDGTVEFRPGERTNMLYYIQKHQLGEDIDIKFMREGIIKTTTVSLTKRSSDTRLVPMDRYDVRPTYYIYGGLVFTPLTLNYLKSWGKDWTDAAPHNLLSFRTHNQPAVDEEQVVVLSKTLPAQVNRGYHHITDWCITEVNGQRIHNIRDLIDALEGTVQEPFAVFKSQRGFKLVLDRKKVESEQQKILETYHIASDRSQDLQ